MMTLRSFFLLLLVTGMSLVSTGTLSAQAWTLNLDTELKNPILSPGGLYLVYGNDDLEAAQCVEVATGKLLWSRPLEDFEEWHIMRFVGDSVVLLGQADRYEFVRPADGEVLTQLKIIDEDWDELEVMGAAEEQMMKEQGMDPIRPHYRANIGIFYFDDGMQILDLEKRTILMETEDSPSKLQYRTWGNVMMVISRGGPDSLWVIDYKQRKVILRLSTDDYEINNSLYQPFAMNDAKDSEYDVEKERDESPSATEIVLFNEEDITSFNPVDGSVNSTIDIETGDPDFFFTIVLDDGLYMMVSEDDEQRFYRTSTGELLWTLPENTIPGIVDKMHDLGDGNALLFAYHDKDATLYKVSIADGSIAWQKPMFKFRGGYEPGHKQAGGFGAFLKTMVVGMLVGGGGYRTNSFGIGSYSSYSARRDRARMMNSIHQGFLSKEKKVKAYMDLVSVEESEVVVVVAGKAHNFEDPDWGEAEQEGIYRISLADGSTVEEKLAPLLAEKDGNLNASADLQFYQLEAANAQALVGVHDIYIVRNGVVESFNFGEETIVFHGNSDSTFSFHTDLDEDQYDFWILDASANPSRFTFFGRSDEPNFVASADTTVKVQALVFNDYTITGHAFPDATPGNVTLGPALWTLTEDDIDDLEIGSLTKNWSYGDRLQGIRSDTSGVLFMGDDGVAWMSSDGSCKWSREWDPNRTKVTFYPKYVEDYLVYGLDEDHVIIRLDCSGTEIAYQEIDASDSYFLVTDPEFKVTPHHTAIMMDVDEGLIWCYVLK